MLKSRSHGSKRTSNWIRALKLITSFWIIYETITSKVVDNATCHIHFWWICFLLKLAVAASDRKQIYNVLGVQFICNYTPSQYQLSNNTCKFVFVNMRSNCFTLRDRPVTPLLLFSVWATCTHSITKVMTWFNLSKWNKQFFCRFKHLSI